MTEPLGQRESSNPERRGRILRADAAADWLEGKRFLEEAKREAQAIRAAAEEAARAERLRGFQEGYREGAEAAARLLAETSTRVDRCLAAMPEELAGILLLALERVLGTFEQRDLVRRAVGHVLEQLRAERAMKIYAAPGLVPELRRLLDDAAGENDALRQIEVEADPKLAPNACVLASDLGFVDLGPEAQVNALREGIRAAFGER